MKRRIRGGIEISEIEHLKLAWAQLCRHPAGVITLRIRPTGGEQVAAENLALT